MRKLMVFLMTSVDGYMAGLDDNIDWHVVDEEFNQFAVDQVKSVGTIVFGRVTYEGMASFWPTPLALETDPEIAALMNSADKIVISSTLPAADWQNTRLISDNVKDALLELKAQQGKDLIIFGSSNLSASLIDMGLIDEIRIIIAPVVLGEGKTLFDGLQALAKLELVDNRVFKSGNVLLTYKPAST